MESSAFGPKYFFGFTGPNAPFSVLEKTDLWCIMVFNAGATEFESPRLTMEY
jgi:hypothetical protein